MTLSAQSGENQVLSGLSSSLRFFLGGGGCFVFFQTTKTTVIPLWEMFTVWKNWSTKRMKVTTGPAQIGIIRLGNPN